MAMTVGELRAKLDGAPESARVVIWRDYRKYDVDPEFTGMGREAEFEIDVDEVDETSIKRFGF